MNAKINNTDTCLKTKSSGTNQTEHIPVWFVENCTTLCSLIARLNAGKTLTLPKYRFNTVPIKTLGKLRRSGQIVLKCMWKGKGTGGPQTIWGEGGGARNGPPDFKT